MVLVQVKTAAFLVRKEGFNLETAAIIPSSLVAIVQGGYQIERSVITTAPPANQVQMYRNILSKTNLVMLENLSFCQWVSANRLALRAFLDMDLWQCPQNKVPAWLLLDP